MEQRRRPDFADGYQTVGGDDFDNQLYEDDVVDYEEEEDSILKFETSDSHQDWQWATVFVIQLLLVTIFSILLTVRPYEAPHSTQGTFTYEQKIEVMQMAVVSCLIAAMMSFCWLIGFHVLTSDIIRISVIGFVGMAFPCGIIAFVYGYAPAGCLLIALSIFCVWFSFKTENHINFSSSILKLVVGITRLYPATIAVALLSTLLQIIWLVLWSFLAISLLTKGTVLTWMEAFLLLGSFWWTTQVLKNVVHVTVAGTIATWYFMHETGMPLNPTLRSLQRAGTTSFGSVCLGSTLVSLFATIRSVVSFARRSNNSTLTFLASCVMRLLDQVMMYFNTYAFTQVAMSGKPFLKAGQDSWVLIKTRGVDSLSNHELVSTSLTWICTGTGIFTGMIAGLWANQHDNLNVSIVAFICYLIGNSVARVLVGVVESGAMAVFVCYADDPEILSRADPVTFSQIRERCCVDHRGDFA